MKYMLFSAGHGNEYLVVSHQNDTCPALDKDAGCNWYCFEGLIPERSFDPGPGHGDCVSYKDCPLCILKTVADASDLDGSV